MPRRYGHPYRMARSQPVQSTLRIEVTVAAQTVDLGPNVLLTGSVYSVVAHVEACLGDKEMQRRSHSVKAVKTMVKVKRIFMLRWSER